MSNRYGFCCECDSGLSPVWFTEFEYEVIGGCRIKTGRKRRACSHLICEFCGHKECVDDSFDGKWE